MWTVISSLPHSLFLCLFYSIIKRHIRNSSINICMPYHWGSMYHPVFQYLFETVMGCLVPFSLISTCYSSVICRLQSAKFQRRGQGSRLILLIIVTFAIFWLPYHVVNIIEVILLMQLLVVVSESVVWRLSLFNFGFWMHLDQLTRQTVRRAIVSGTSAFKARLWLFVKWAVNFLKSAASNKFN